MADVIDCGDNSCLFAPKKGGMRTNGGCRCYRNAGFPDSGTMAARQMLPEIARLRAEVARLEAVLRETHTNYCCAAYTDRDMHAPECLLYEIEDAKEVGR